MGTLSSAEDRSSTIIAFSPGSSNSAPEESPVESPRSEKEEKPATPSALSKPAVDPDEDSTSPLKTKPLPKASAVAFQARIKVTGARAGSTSAERELFTESTTTVLVFENGGVIRLAAAVTPGQLLFLTNEESKREIVAQVVRKRAFRPTECYVELEFTAPASGFWGTEFSAVAALLPKDEKEAAAAEMVASAETTADEPEGATPHPMAEEVESLKKEVEALRSQLRGLQAHSEPPPPVVAAPRMPVPPVLPMPSAPVPPVIAVSNALASPAVTAPPEAPAQREAPTPPADSVPVASFKAKSLPIEPEPVPSWMAPASLPKPALGFRAALPKRKRPSRARGQFTPDFRAGLLRLALPCLALVGLIGILWFKHWLPGMHASKKTMVSASAGGVTTAASAPKTPPPTPGPAAAQTQTARPVTGNHAPDSSIGDLDPVSPKSLPGEPVAESKQSPGSSESLADLKQPAARERATFSGSSFPHSSAKPSPAKVIDALPTFEQDPNLVPPKLVKFTRAVVSLNEVHDFETGDVVVNAVVDAQGDVQAMNVVSGPPSLRKPAMKALKNYKYQPATLNGKPVPARVTVKIQFHFEP
jgi:TonB family protein